MLRKWGIAAGLLAIMCEGAASEGSFDRLLGAWTMGNNCSEIFVREGDEWKFRNRGSSLNTGLIIRGNTITGSYGTCSFKRIVSRDDHYAAMLSCESAVIFSDITVHFRLVDRNHFARFDPDFPEFYVTYQKCES